MGVLSLHPFSGRGLAWAGVLDLNAIELQAWGLRETKRHEVHGAIAQNPLRLGYREDESIVDLLFES